MSSYRFRDDRGPTPEFSLILPAYNPGRLLAKTLDELARFTRSCPDRYEFVVVCDGCTDGSSELARTAPFVRVISYAPNRGKGFAVRQGLLAASAPYRIFTDIDLAYSFEDIQRVARLLRDGADAAIASRAHSQSTIQLTPQTLGYAYRRQIQSGIFSTLVRWLLPIRCGDTQAGLKGFSERVVRDIVPRMTCDGFGFDCEMLTACMRLGYSVTETPVQVRYDSTGSTTSVRSTLRMVKELWRIRKAWPASLTREASPAVPPQFDSRRSLTASREAS